MLPCSCKEICFFWGGFTASVLPPAAHGSLGSIPGIPRWGGRRGFGAAEGLWEYPAPRGGRDFPSCTNAAAPRQPGAAFNRPKGAPTPLRSVAKHHPKAAVPAGSLRQPLRSAVPGARPDTRGRALTPSRGSCAAAAALPAVPPARPLLLSWDPFPASGPHP